MILSKETLDAAIVAFSNNGRPRNMLFKSVEEVVNDFSPRDYAVVVAAIKDAVEAATPHIIEAYEAGMWQTAPFNFRDKPIHGFGVTQDGKILATTIKRQSCVGGVHFYEVYSSRYGSDYQYVDDPVKGLTHFRTINPPKKESFIPADFLKNEGVT